MTAALLATAGIIALSLASVVGAVRVLAHDSNTLANAFDAALEDPQVRIEIETEISNAIEDSLFDPALTAQAARFGIDVETEIATLAPAVLDDPAFRAALDDLVSTTHERVLLERSDAPIDITPLTAAVIDVIERELPEAAPVMPSDSALFELDAEQLPDLTGPADLLDRSLMVLAIAGLALPLAWVIHPQRHRVMAWTGRWLLVTGVVAACLAVGLPYVGGKLTGYSVVEVAIREISTRLLAPAALAGIVGAGLAAAATLLKSRERQRASDAGAAAAFGVDEPELLGISAQSRQMELARRGLVDVNQPLTNI